MTKTPSLRPWYIKLQPGRPLVLRGPAGCGKTTLAREIAAAHGRFFEVQADRLQPPMLVAPDPVRDKPRPSGRGRIARTAQPSFGI